VADTEARPQSPRQDEDPPNCAARTHENDIRPIAEVAAARRNRHRSGDVSGFQPIRRLVEDWDCRPPAAHTGNAVRFALTQGLPVMYVTEDTTPPTRRRSRYSLTPSIVGAAPSSFATPSVTPADRRLHLVKFAPGAAWSTVGERSEWIGTVHCDRGLAIANSLAAIAAGGQQFMQPRIHWAAAVGNTPRS